MSLSSHVRSLLIGAAALTSIATTSAAQACLGRAGFGAGMMRAGLGYTSFPGTDGAPDASQLEGEFGIGAPEGAFGAASITRYTVSGDGVPQVTEALNGGYAWRVPQAVPLEFCPIASIAFSQLPTDAFTSSASNTTFMLGGSFGAPFAAGDNTTLVPFVGASYASQSESATATSLNGGGTFHATVAYGLFEGGVGIIINRTITLRPSILRYFGFGPGNPPSTAYAFGVSLNFGASSPATK